MEQKEYINKIYNENCFDFFKKIPDKEIDLILCDLPYGTTANKWDTPLDLDILWKEYNRIIKDDGIIVLTSQQPFTSILINSQIDLFRYNWIWKKDTPTGFLNCAYRPLTIFEDICVFSKAKVGSLSKNPIKYFPQGVIEKNITKKNKPNSKWRKQYGYDSKKNVLNSDKEYTQKYTNYPNQILEFKRDKDTFHPTQKPVALFEYLIKTYTKEGDLVLDNCLGSGTTALAAKNTNRLYTGCELNTEYYEKSLKRL